MTQCVLAYCWQWTKYLYLQLTDTQHCYILVSFVKRNECLNPVPVIIALLK
uniref:Uncharacterized protein n=1 Tax=Salvator merianae TaxID=96440 RepID=A0A8D0BD40_SALMN